MISRLRKTVDGRRSTVFGEEGLTLLELLITLILLSVMSIITLEAFRIGSRSWEKGEQRAEAEQRIRVIHGALAQELASLQSITAIIDGKQVMAFQGRPDRILFYSGPDRHRPFPYGAMVRSLAYSVEPGKGLVVQEGYPLVEGKVSLDPRGEVKVLDPKATRIRLRYLATPSPGEKDSRWVETWEPGDGRGDLPLAVEVTIAIVDERGEREQSFPFPIHVGGRF